MKEPGCCQSYPGKAIPEFGVAFLLIINTIGLIYHERPPGAGKMTAGKAKIRTFVLLLRNY